MGWQFQRIGTVSGLGDMSQSIATILIPYSEAHAHLVARAEWSAKRQSVPCDVIAALSPGTPAKHRNYPLYHEVTTPFVVWLDADDHMERNFVEECLRYYETGRYVYTAYTMWNKIVIPDAKRPFADGNHLITTLYPTEVFKSLGGFDENLPGHEDIDFYLKSIASGVCGVLCPKPLVHYEPDGQRSTAFAENPAAEIIRKRTLELYGGTQTIMGCCGGEGVPFTGDPGKQQPGDVLVQALWAGCRDELDLSRTRKVRACGGQSLWIDLATAQSNPAKYRILANPAEAPKKQDVLQMAGLT